MATIHGVVARMEDTRESTMSAKLVGGYVVSAVGVKKEWLACLLDKLRALSIQSYQ